MAYTTIDDPSAYFHTQLYNSNNGYAVSVVNDANAGNFKPDLLWVKSREDIGGYAISHNLIDSSRGVTKTLFSDKTAGESTASQSNYDLTSFDTNGFTNGAPESTNSLGGGAGVKVAWQWKANGGTTANNTTGSLASVVQANTTAGFSIVTWTGAGGARTVGHGLGVTPDLIIVKNRSTATQWGVWINSLADTDNNFRLNETRGEIDDALWNDTVPTSSVFSISSAAEVSNNSIAYCFANVQGYSKFGGYIGNGSADGAMIYTGFRPALVMIKKNGTSEWFMSDIKRGIRNSASGTTLSATNNYSETTIGPTNYDIDFVSNGFQHRQGNSYMNASKESYIYAAWAEHPFVTSTGVPTTAR